MATSPPPAIPDPTQPRRTRKPRREELAPGACLCDHCSGKCCRYFSLPIATPTTRREFDAVYRYLAHGQTLAYVEKGTWYLVVMTRCNYLDRDNHCLIYHARPKICREYTTAECEYDDDWIFEKVFETPEQIREYAEAILPPRRDPIAEGEGEGGSLPFSVSIEEPTTWDDFDAIRWYLAHGQTAIYVRHGAWYLAVGTRREGPRAEPDAGRLFETPDQLWEYAEAVLRPRPRPRKPAAPALVVISPPG